MAHNWDEFNRFESKYMPDYGDGDTMAAQAETALNKLVYRWYNDGDVYDNQHGMAGWANDISGSANWLANHFPGAKQILDRIYDIGSDEGEYEDILYDLCCLIHDTPNLLDSLNNIPKIGNAYSDEGPYKFEYYEEEEEYWEEEEETFDEEEEDD